MAITLKPVDEIPGNRTGESRELFEEFLASGAQYAQLQGVTAKDRSRLQSATQGFNRGRAEQVRVRSRGDDCYLERVTAEA